MGNHAPPRHQRRTWRSIGPGIACAPLFSAGMRESLAQALTALNRALRSVGAAYMIIGGVAVIARGVPRLTDDVDATIWGGGLDMNNLLAKLEKEGIQPRIDGAVEFARQHQVLLLHHAQSLTDMEVSLAWLPFEEEALQAANDLDLAGASVPVARAEDLIVYKAVAWRDRDRSDVERLLKLHGATIDMGRVRRIVAEFAEALEQPDKVEQFDQFVRKVFPGGVKFGG